MEWLPYSGSEVEHGNIREHSLQNVCSYNQSYYLKYTKNYTSMNNSGP